MKVGDTVWYWARRVGEKAHKKYGVITAIDPSGEWARLTLFKGTVAVQTVAVNRLRLPVDDVPWSGKK